jgi:hypothetical protein
VLGRVTSIVGSVEVTTLGALDALVPREAETHAAWLRPRNRASGRCPAFVLLPTR